MSSRTFWQAIVQLLSVPVYRITDIMYQILKQEASCAFKYKKDTRMTPIFLVYKTAISQLPVCMRSYSWHMPFFVARALSFK